MQTRKETLTFLSLSELQLEFPLDYLEQHAAYTSSHQRTIVCLSPSFPPPNNLLLTLRISSQTWLPAEHLPGLQTSPGGF